MPLALLFTGHMVDLPGRPKPRFPQALVGAARARIGAALAPFAGRVGVTGIASLARGGDILFHEEARRQGIATTIVLPFAPKPFIGTSVAGVPGTDWTERFERLWAATPLMRREDLGLPVEDESYAACNSRMLDLARAAGDLHLVALWDGGGGDGPGGAGDLIRKAEAAGDRPTIIAPADLK